MIQINCAIIDDEQPARDLLENFLVKVPSLRLVGKFKSPIHALNLIHEQQIDLIFLDIQMPDIKGTDFLRTVKNVPPVIFTTAYANYALEGFNLDVVDYLVKPFSFDRYLQAVNKATERVLAKRYTPEAAAILSIQADHRLYRLNAADVLYIESMREYVAYYLSDGRKIMALQSMRGLETSLTHDFVRVHRSFIVNVNHISYLEGNSLMIKARRIPIGGSYRKSVDYRFGN